jgi:hypothetical protein
MSGRIITFLFWLMLVSMPLFLTSCEAVGDAIKYIFAAGFWIGVILVVAVIILIIWIIKKLF